MKKILVLSVLLVLPALSGCTGTWPRPFWLRGDRCMSTGCYSSDAVYLTPPPPAVTELPGPAAPEAP